MARQIGLEQFFTKDETSKELACVIHEYCPGAFVDCSCGTGKVGSLLDKMGHDVWCYDIVDAHVSEDTPRFEKRDWFTLKPNHVPFPRTACIGFNPPFGSHCGLVRKFVRHALLLAPDAPYVFFIAPFISCNLGIEWLPDGFILHKRIELGRNTFQRPNGREFSYNTSFHIWTSPSRIDARPRPYQL